VGSRTEGGEARGPEVEKMLVDLRGGKRLDVINIQAKSIERWCHGRRVWNQRCKAPFEVVSKANEAMVSMQSRMDSKCNGGFCDCVKLDDPGNTPT